jgi:hypothetical protein
LEYNEAVHHLFIHLKKAYDSVRREVLYDFPIEFGIFLELVRLMKICSRVRLCKNLSDIYPIKNTLRKVDALSLLLFSHTVENNIRRVLVEIV